MNLRDLDVQLKHIPSLEPEFMPLKPYKDAYEKSVAAEGGMPMAIAVEREGGQTSVYRYACHRDERFLAMDCTFTERLVKYLLWMKGGYKVYICGNPAIADYVAKKYDKAGDRAFDVTFMERVYEQEFQVVDCTYDETPEETEEGFTVAGELGGCRIGFDAGGSDMKVCAVKDGEVLFAEEVVWLPKLNDDPAYHQEHIKATIEKAAGYLPRVDAIGISSAGVFVANRCMVASLFILIEGETFDKKVKNMFLDIASAYTDGEVVVLNDGDVAAVAGAMNLGTNNVMGIAMGTSEAVGFVGGDGKIKGWLNELAFAPVDFNEGAMEDEWSGDVGCGCKYFSQDAVIKLAHKAGIELDSSLTLAEKLKVVQGLMEEGDPRAVEIFENIGVYLGHTLAFYHEFYGMGELLLLGRVMSGKGGDTILAKAKEVIKDSYPAMDKVMKVSLPDEKSRRVGQSVAAASIPKI